MFICVVMDVTLIFMDTQVVYFYFGMNQKYIISKITCKNKDRQDTIIYYCILNIQFSIKPFYNYCTLYLYMILL